MTASHYAFLPAVFALSGFFSPMGIDAVKAALEPEPVWPAVSDAGIEPGNGAMARVAMASPVPDRQSSKATQFRRSGDGLFYLGAVVNGKPIRFVLDTGSSVVVLTRADAKAIGIETSRLDFDGFVQTAGGNAPMAWTTIDHVRVGDRHARVIRAVVVRDGLKVSLLGQNVISQLGSVTIAGDRLNLH